MFGNADIWPHQVEIKLDRRAFDPKRRTIETWLHEWEIPYRIGSNLLDAGTLRISFADEKFVRAFINHYGGRVVPADEIQAALAADTVDEDVYERLAREFPD